MKKNSILPLEKVNLFFQKYFKSLKAEIITSFDRLDKFAEELCSSKTIYGAKVFNKVYQTSRLPQQSFDSTYWRDKQITRQHLEICQKAKEMLLKKKIPLYSFWLRSGSGNQSKIWQLFFTKKGVPLVLAGAIMMEPIFDNPQKKGLVINGYYFAVPELLELLPNASPLILFNAFKNKPIFIWIGGSDYPGEIYKPICKAHNGWVYDSGGFEIHAAAYTANYINKKAQKEKTLVIISGLSLHGKSALSTTNGVQPAFYEGLTNEQEVFFEGIHDDYIAFLPLNKQKTCWEVFAYAPYGLFPACKGEKPDNPLIANKRTALYSVYIDKNGTPDFNKQINQTDNQRAAAPIDNLEVFRQGQRQVKDFKRLVIIILTRNNFCPSAIIFKSPVDFAWSYAGVVVQKTNAIKGDFPEIYYNFCCTDFDVIPRHLYLQRLVKTLKNIPQSVTLAMINTGAPQVEESMKVRDAIAANWYQATLDKKLGVEVVTYVPGFKKLYYPWEQGGYTYDQVIKEWQTQQKERRDFMANKTEIKGNCDPKKLERLIGKPHALV